MTPDRLGLLIGAVFGLVYVVVNAGELDAPAGPLLQGLGVLAFVGVLAALRRGHARPSGNRAGSSDFGRGYQLVVVAEVIAIIAGIAALNGPLDLEDGVLPWVSLVVGTHFLALARIWRAPSLAWTGAGIALLGAIGLGLAAGDASKAAIAAVAGVGPGALLLVGSLWGATR